MSENLEPTGGTTFDRGVDAAFDVVRVGLRPFAAPSEQPRVRRATDVVVLVPALLGLALATALYPPSSFELSLVRLLDALPGWLAPVWAFCADLLWLWAILLVAACLIGRRWFVVGQSAISLVIGIFVGGISARIALGSWPTIIDALLGTASAPEFPDVRVAVSVAVVGTVSPHVVRPLRKVGLWVAALGVLGAAVVDPSTPGGVAAGVLIGLIAAAAANLLLGTSAGRPGLADVATGLAQLGVDATDLVADDRQVAGVLRAFARDREGRQLVVKVYGRDAADNQLISRLWRRLWYRRAGPAVGTSRLHAAEHEAFVTLLARDGGVSTLDVVTAAATASDDAILVLRGDAIPLARLAPDAISATLLDGAWSTLARLDALRIAHQQIDPEAVVLVGDRIGFVELGGAAVAPDLHQLETDRAQLLVTTAALAGPEPALEAAVRALGAAGVASLLPYLQSAALGGPLRKAVKAAGLDVDELRDRAAGAVGVEPPELARLRRVSAWSAVQVALFALAAYAIVSAVEGVDWEEVRTSVADASWGWIVAAFVAAQLPRVTQALATLGSVPAPLPFGPVYGMQLATGYMNVALPSNLARMAVNIRFFQRQGLSAPTAVAAGAIDSFAGTVVQAILLALLLLFSESSLALELPFPSGGSETLLWIVVGAAAVSLLLLVVVSRIRHAITDGVRRWWPDVRATLGSLRVSHKLALLVLGSLATEVLFAVALGFFTQSFGYGLPLAELLVINISVSLLGSLVPVPGNIGVAEFGLTVGLTSAGMSPEAAVAAVLLYRIATFYLPPVWGFVALRWLQRNRYL